MRAMLNQKMPRAIQTYKYIRIPGTILLFKYGNRSTWETLINTKMALYDINMAFKAFYDKKKDFYAIRH